MTLDKQLYTMASAATMDDLMKEIDNMTKLLAKGYGDISIQSISHDVITQYNGAFLWTALITVNVDNQKEQDVKEDHS